MTVSETQTILSRYAGANFTYIDRLNEVIARLMQSGSWKGTKRQIALDIGSDFEGNAIITLPRNAKTILAGAVRNTDVLCTGLPLAVRNEFTEFDENGLGYGGITDGFYEVPGRFAVFQEWDTPMYIRLYFEATESAGTVHLWGTFEEEDVYSLYSGSWIKGEKVAFVGTTTVTSTKKFDAPGFRAVKPVTNGRISVYVVDDDDNETHVGTWDPTETTVLRKRYKVPEYADVTVTTTSDGTSPTYSLGQSYTRDEIDSFFADSGTITVDEAGTTNLSYTAYFIRRARVIAEAGSGAYTHKFTLDTGTPKIGAVFRINLEMAASANPTVQFYNESASGTLLAQVDPDSSNAQYATFVFTFDGTEWRFDGREL